MLNWYIWFILQKGGSLSFKLNFIVNFVCSYRSKDLEFLKRKRKKLFNDKMCQSSFKRQLLKQLSTS